MTEEIVKLPYDVSIEANGYSDFWCFKQVLATNPVEALSIALEVYIQTHTEVRGYAPAITEFLVRPGSLENPWWED